MKSINNTKCFAYDTINNRCIALTETACKECVFFKTHKQQDALIKKYGWLGGDKYQRTTEQIIVCSDDDKMFVNYLAAAQHYNIMYKLAHKIIQTCDGNQRKCCGHAFRWATTKEVVNTNNMITKYNI